ncbi:gasdermin-A2-like isoform X1 [Lepisosteus oculatus]|uniref:gasdermin-A2-like isoform X1 n=1 Tax=Lepisosteus oculatus TaxID=7918 RepID=UPI0035F50B28
MFHQATQFMTKELDPTGSLVPMRSIASSSQFQNLRVVRKVVPFFPWRPNKYLPTCVELKDILEQGDNVDAGLNSTLTITLTKSSEGNSSLSGQVTASQVEVDSKVSLDHTTNLGSFCVEVMDMDFNKLMKELQNAKIDMSHWLVQKLSRERAHGLGVIISSVRAKSQLLIKQSCSRRGYLKLSMAPVVPVTEMQANMVNSNKWEMLVQEGTILAFKVYELSLRGDGKVGAVSSPTRKKTFISDGIAASETQIHGTAFQEVKADIDKCFRELTVLDSKGSAMIWTLLTKLLAYSDALGVLEYMIAEGRTAADEEPSLVEGLSPEAQQAVLELLQFLEPFQSETGEDQEHELQRALALLVDAFEDLNVQTVLNVTSLSQDLRQQQIQLVERKLEQKDVDVQLLKEEVPVAKELFISWEVEEEPEEGENLSNQPPRDQVLQDKLLALYIVLRAAEAVHLGAE